MLADNQLLVVVSGYNFITSQHVASSAQTPTGATGMTEEQDRRRRILVRLARVEGQIRGIRAMIEADSECEDVAVQLTAARRALDRAFYDMLACSLLDQVAAASDIEDVRASANEMARLLAKMG